MPESKHSLEIRPLSAVDAENLTRMLASADPAYVLHFFPFPFKLEAIREILESKKEDQYYGIYSGTRLAGFFMLRGFDQGYQVPAYGVFIDESYRSLGLATLSLYHAISFCKTNRIGQLMLKVHPDNAAARHVYEKAGFRKTGRDEKIGQDIYILDITK